jgi:hypothetical protein
VKLGHRDFPTPIDHPNHRAFGVVETTTAASPGGRTLSDAYFTTVLWINFGYCSENK